MRERADKCEEELQRLAREAQQAEAREARLRGREAEYNAREVDLKAQVRPIPASSARSFFLVGGLFKGRACRGGRGRE